MGLPERESDDALVERFLNAVKALTPFDILTRRVYSSLEMRHVSFGSIIVEPNLSPPPQRNKLRLTFCSL